jgi:hypothetical protein
MLNLEVYNELLNNVGRWIIKEVKQNDNAKEYFT